MTTRRRFKAHHVQSIYNFLRMYPPTRARSTVTTAYFHGVAYVNHGHALIEYPRESELGAAQAAGVDNACAEAARARKEQDGAK